MRLAMIFGLTVIVLYTFVLIGMYLGQRRLMYFPTTDNPSPDAFGLTNVFVDTVETSDSERLILWYAEAERGQPTIVFFHGNAGEMANRWNRFAAYQATGLGVVFVSYRGYGGSSGTPSEEGLHRDADAAYGWIRAQGVAAADVVVVGASLGTGVAVQLAARQPVGALALTAPYSATDDVAADLYRWLPVRLLMRDRFRSVDHIGSVTAPIFIQHGTSDVVVPYASGQALLGAAPVDTQFVSVSGVGHELLFEPDAWQREIAFIQQIYEDR